jgi:hypothetical protein
MSGEIYIDRFLASRGQEKIVSDLLDFKIKKITWDFDQIMFASEVPVKKDFYLKTGINCLDWPIDRWLALTERAVAESSMSYEEAKAIEMKSWMDPDILVQSKPIRAIQLYSKIAFLKGVKQSVVTARAPSLHEATTYGIQKYFNWIPEKDVHIRKDESVNGKIFKGMTVGIVDPEVHFEDSTADTESVLAHSNASVMLFSRSMERDRFLDNKRVIELSDMAIFASLFK